VGLHSSEVVTLPLERIFIDFFGPIIRRRKGNIAVLVVLDGFSKFVCMYPVRRISSEVVKTFLLEKFFPAYEFLSLLFRTMRRFSNLEPSTTCVFLGEFGSLPPRPITPKRLKFNASIAT
jgi:hypothetical protein